VISFIGIKFGWYVLIRRKYKFDMFEYNWIELEYEKYKEGCMLECKMDIHVWKIVC
jgi:hypothetical protein